MVFDIFFILLVTILLVHVKFISQNNSLNLIQRYVNYPRFRARHRPGENADFCKKMFSMSMQVDHQVGKFNLLLFGVRGWTKHLEF